MDDLMDTSMPEWRTRADRGPVAERHPHEGCERKRVSDGAVDVARLGKAEEGRK